MHDNGRQRLFTELALALVPHFHPVTLVNCVSLSLASGSRAAQVRHV